MNAIDLLESQHHEIEALFEKILHAATREMKEKFLIRLADSLAIHASIEEHHLFPATRQKGVPESLEEHLAIRHVLGDLLDVEVEDDTFNAKMAALLETPTIAELAGRIEASRPVSDEAELERLLAEIEALSLDEAEARLAQELQTQGGTA